MVAAGALAALAAVVGGCAGTTRRLNDADTVQLALENQTHETVCFLYLSPRGRDSWSDDLLSGSIDPGRRRAIRRPPGGWALGAGDCEHEAVGIQPGARIARGTTLLLQ